MNTVKKINLKNKLFYKKELNFKKKIVFFYFFNIELINNLNFNLFNVL